jgi:predicted alpha/beta-hydrolase family hydrolase
MRQLGGRGLVPMVVLAALVASIPVVAANEEVRSVPTRRGVTQGFLLVRPSGSPVASVILFAGGEGRLALSSSGIGQLRGNFLVRTRERFARAGFLVALVDTPSDRADYWNFRTSGAHAEDVKQVIAALRAIAPVPVWVVGTSMGTLSAANAAARLTEGGPDGLVLTSTVTQTSRQSGESVRTVRLGEIRVPTLIVLHRDDGCRASPPSDAPTVLKALTQSPRKEILTFEGGSPPRSEPCEAMAQHGFLGIEADVVEAIARWIRAQSPS